MIELKAHTLKLQRLENSAADKAGMRFQLIDEGGLLGKGSAAYIDAYAAQLLKDITPEILEAVKLGLELGEAINAKV
ncbi:MAG: hypothetical protein ACYDH3_00320 [Candidatus Aminicenantales bacterium]